MIKEFKKSVISTLLSICITSIASQSLADTYIDGQPAIDVAIGSAIGTVSNWVSTNYIAKGSPGTQTNLAPYYNDAGFAYSSRLSSTTIGDEGIRLIGALGGYLLDEFLTDTSLRGTSRDFTIFTYNSAPASDLTVSWTDGDVYSPEDGYFHIVGGTNTLINNSINYAYWSMVSRYTIQWTTTRPSVDSNIVFATFVTAFGMIIEYDPPEAAGDFPLNTRAGAARIAPSLIVSGMDYFPISTNLNAIGMNAGLEYHDMRVPKNHQYQDLRNPTQTVGILTYVHTNVGYWGYSLTNMFPIGLRDNGTNVAVCDSSSWYRGLFLSLPNSPFMHYIYPRVAYTSSVDAIAGSDPALPPGFDPYVPLCTAYVFAGSDTVLRTDSQYWVDRRFQIRRPNTSTASSSSTLTPSLNQVMIAGASLGGILPNDAGLPTTSDQLTSKAYVDSTINNINNNTAYVDDNTGNDTTALLESSIRPFKTIQAAINEAATVANDTNRYILILSPGTYNENVTMKNYIGVVGKDMEATKIIGSIAYPHAYTDTIGAEVALLTILSSNTPAVIFDSGSDDGYMGLRSCYLVTLYDNDTPYKSVVKVNRGLTELYATTYCELQVIPTNGSSTISEASIFEHTTDVGNNGLSTFTAFGMSSLITCTDTNDNINYMFTHDNLDAKCINTSIGSALNVHLEDSTSHANNVRVVSHDTVIGRTFSQGTIIRTYLNATNACNLSFGRAKNGTGDNVAIVRGNHFRIIGCGTSNIWFGAAITTNDSLRVYDSVYINNLPDYTQPRIYTNDGSAGKYFLNTVAENGDHLFGGALDFAILNTPSVTTPQVGHVKFYANPYAGIENLYMKDSSGNVMRDFRDNFYNGYNDDTTNMRVGDPVYISAGLSPNNTPKVKKSMARDPSTMPAIGVVSHFGGIATGQIGRVMIMGRLENFIDTSAFTSGQKLYVGIDGGVTNVAPTGTNISQMIGTCHIASTNGYFNVLIRGTDMLGGMTPSVLNAATVGGLTPEQLIAQQQTYYIWGSLAGAFPSSRLVQLANPSDQPARTNVYNSVTNNMRFSGLCINTNENPRILTKGVVAIHTTTSRTGDSNPRTLKGRVRIFESDASTLVVEYWSTNTSTSVICVTNIHENVIFVDIPVDTPIADLNRIIVGDTMSDTGWTGTESIRFLSQDGYLSRLIIPAASAGIYAPLQMVEDIQVRTNDWNTASTDSTAATNWIATNTIYAAATSYANGASNNVLSQATVLANNASNGAVNVANAYTLSTSNLVRLVAQAYSDGVSNNSFAYTLATSNLNSIVDQAYTLSTSNLVRIVAQSYANGVSNNSFAYTLATSNLNSIVDQAYTLSTSNLIRIVAQSYADGVSNNVNTQMNTKDTVISNSAVSYANGVSNNVNTQMNTKDTVVSNAFVAADTVISNSAVSYANGVSNNVNTQMNTKDTVISNSAVAYANGVSNNVYSMATNYANGLHVGNVCEQSIGVGKTQQFTSSGVIVTNWGSLNLAGTDFTTSHSNITVVAAGNYEVSSYGSWSVVNGDLRGVLFTNGVAAVDGAGNNISWRCNNQNSGIYVSFGVSRNITLSAGTRLDWRITSVATETVTWDNINWEIEKY